MFAHKHDPASTQTKITSNSALMNLTGIENHKR